MLAVQITPQILTKFSKIWTIINKWLTSLKQDRLLWIRISKIRQLPRICELSTILWISRRCQRLDPQTFRTNLQLITEKVQMKAKTKTKAIKSGKLIKIQTMTACRSTFQAQQTQTQIKWLSQAPNKTTLMHKHPTPIIYCRGKTFLAGKIRTPLRLLKLLPKNSSTPYNRSRCNKKNTIRCFNKHPQQTTIKGMKIMCCSRAWSYLRTRKRLANWPNLQTILGVRTHKMVQ